MWVSWCDDGVINNVGDAAAAAAADDDDDDTDVAIVSDQVELSFLNSLVAFAHQMLSLKLTDSELALLCALVLVNPSECHLLLLLTPPIVLLVSK